MDGQRALIPPTRERLFTNLCATQAISRRTVSLSKVLCEETAEAWAESLRVLIGRRLSAGRLPHDSVAIIHGAPGVDGACDACARPLTPRQLVMSVPFKQGFVYLHADCFMAWNAVRHSRAAFAQSA
jgi:hypothetical protein